MNKYKDMKKQYSELLLCIKGLKEMQEGYNAAYNFCSTNKEALQNESRK